MSPVYFTFLMNQWKLCQLTEPQVQNAITKGYITEEEAGKILATPRNCGG